MNNDERLPPLLLKRKAVVYVRQSTQTQVQKNYKGFPVEHKLNRSSL